MARNFNGSSGRIDLSVGACGVAFGGHTVAAIARSGNDGASIKSLIAATADASWQFFCRNGTIQFWNGAATDAFGGSCDFAIADSWCVVGVSKASGSATPRAHRIRIDQSGGVPNRHAAGDGNKANSGVPTGLRVGSQGPTPTDFYNGDIALVALWPAVLTDAQFESLAFGLDAWFQIAPLGLWLIDQDSTSQKVIDLTGGGANQSGINGTSIQAASVPFSYGARILIVAEAFAATSDKTITGVRASATASGRVGTPTVQVAGARAGATAAARLGAPSIAVPGVRAAATAAGRAGTPTISVTGVRAAATASGRTGTPTLIITGVRASATAAGRPGSTGSDHAVAGSRAAATASGRTGTPQIIIAGVRASASATANVGIPRIVVAGARASASASGRVGGISLASAGVRAGATAGAVAGYVRIAVTGQRAGATASGRAGSLTGIAVELAAIASGRIDAGQHGRIEGDHRGFVAVAEGGEIEE